MIDNKFKFFFKNQIWHIGGLILLFYVGYQMVDFGVSHTPEANDPMAPKLSLIHFKEQFNARGVLRVAYQKDYCE